MRPLLPVLLLLLAVPASAQYVYGEPDVKKYYAIDCEVEIASITKGKAVGFKTAAAAETAGYVRGDKCTKAQKAAPPKPDMDPISGAKPARPVSNGSQLGTSGKPIRLKLNALISDVVSYVDRDVQVRASIKISSSYSGVFEGMEKIAYAFEISDETGSLTAYMDRGPQSEGLRRILLGEALGKDLVGLVTIRIPRNNYSSKNFWTQAFFLGYSDLKIWDN